MAEYPSLESCISVGRRFRGPETTWRALANALFHIVNYPYKLGRLTREIREESHQY